MPSKRTETDIYQDIKNILTTDDIHCLVLDTSLCFSSPGIPDLMVLHSKGVTFLEVKLEPWGMKPRQYSVQVEICQKLSTPNNYRLLVFEKPIRDGERITLDTQVRVYSKPLIDSTSAKSLELSSMSFGDFIKNNFY